MARTIDRTESESRKLLSSLRDALAESGNGQERLDRITSLIADSMQTEVCSVYLFRDQDTLELCATKGLKREAVHQSRLRVGEGLVGRVARDASAINSADAPNENGFRFLPETGEEIYSSFLGVPINRLGEKLGVLVVQSEDARIFSADEIYGLEVVAMVLAEMAELGAFVGDGAALEARHQRPVVFEVTTAQEGISEGQVWLHDPRVIVTNPFADDPEAETLRLHDALKKLREDVDYMISTAVHENADQMEILEAYRMFARSRGWLRRMEADIASGLSAEAAVEKEQSAARARMGQVADAYLRDRLHDLDDLSNRLLRILTGQGAQNGSEMPEAPILVARNIGPGELLEYGRRLRGVVLEEGSVGSHAAIVARALSIPLVIQAERITAEALNGDHVLIDAESGRVHLRPEEAISKAFRDKMAMAAKAQARYASIRNEPATSVDGIQIAMNMNAGLMADLPSMESSGAEAVGLFRTELQFLLRNSLPKRRELAELYSRVIDAAGGRAVIFRTLDIGSDKVLPFLKPQDEPNPAMGWRAVRVGLDRRAILRVQLQALLRAAAGKPLWLMFPFVAEPREYYAARAELDRAIERERKLGRNLPSDIKVGAMLETPSLAFAAQKFYEDVDFISVGGNDLKQFFFAADRENERVRRRYDVLHLSYLSLLKHISERANAAGTPISYCGEDAGRPIEAICLAALGFHALSMRPASIGPVKHLIRRVELARVAEIIEKASQAGKATAREDVMYYLRQLS